MCPHKKWPTNEKRDFQGNKEKRDLRDQTKGLAIIIN